MEPGETEGRQRFSVAPYSGIGTKYCNAAFKNSAQSLLIHVSSCHGLLFQSFFF